MKSKLFSILLVLSVILCSCEKNMDNNSSTDNFTPPMGDIISVSQALSNLDDILVNININNNNTKTGIVKYNKSDITVIGGNNTAMAKKSSSMDNTLPDTLLYIVNFDNGGFAVLSANTILEAPVLCVTESGNLSQEDFDKAMNFIHRAQKSKNSQNEDGEFTDIGPVFVPISIISYAKAQINIGGPQIGGPQTGQTTVYRYDILSKIGPLLETRWDQLSPYNNFHPNGYPAGCVAVATAQILAYNEVGKDNYNWTLLKTVGNINGIPSSREAEMLVSNFMQEVGSYKNCRITYGEGSSGGWTDGAKRTFKNFGYKDVRKYYGFENADKVRVNSHLSYGKPLYMSGTAGNKGHAWVIDGILVRNKINMFTNQFIKREELYHINWGWRGACNGYYTQGIFDVSERVDTEFGVDLPENSSNDPAYYPENFTWNYKTIIYSL